MNRVNQPNNSGQPLPQQLPVLDDQPMDLPWLLDALVASEPLWGSLGEGIAVPMHLAESRLLSI